MHRENSASGPQTRCPGKDQTPEGPQGLGTVLLIGLFEVEVIVTVSPIKKQRRGRGEAGGEGGWSSATKGASSQFHLALVSL